MLNNSGSAVDLESIDFYAAGSELNGAAISIPVALVPGKSAVEIVLYLHHEKPEHHAFILGSSGELSNWFASGPFDIVEDLNPAEETLSVANAMTIESWRKDRRSGLGQLAVSFWQGIRSALSGNAKWPKESSPQHDFVGSIDLTRGDYYGEVAIGLSPAPVERWWETAAYLRFGGWNACPEPAVHAMLHKIWAEQYGAKLVTMHSDTIELSIDRPVTSREEAIKLARLQYEYCEDLVEQGVGTVENLAASLIGATTWFFWWD